MILTAAGACKAAVVEPPSTSVKISILSGRPVVSQVFLNGQGPFRFLLDTGAETNQVDAALARKLGLTATFQVELQTASGATHSRGGRVSHVSLGSAEASNQEFLFTNLDGLHTLSPDLQGILGQEFLAHFDYTLDFHEHRLTFGPAPGAATHMPVRLVDGRMALSTSLGELVLDSGTDSLILFRSAVQPATGQIRGSSGETAAASLERLSELRIGGRVYRLAKTAVEPQPGAHEAGLLPASLFRALFISNSGGYVVVDPARTTHPGMD
jgi:hypothetical protein